VQAGSALIHFLCMVLCLQYFAMDYLLKTEPTVYSFTDLEREKTTIWDGVTNPAAVKHLREMKPAERLVIYHTGDEKKRGGNGLSSVGGCKRSQNSASKDQAWKADREAEDTGGNQGATSLRGVSTGKTGKVKRGATDAGAVRMAGGRVNPLFVCTSPWRCLWGPLCISK